MTGYSAKSMRVAIVAALVCVAAYSSAFAQSPKPAAIPISGPTDFTQQAFDVLHYDAYLDFTKAPSRDMKGICTITLRWVSDPASGPFYFHLRDLHVDSVYYNNTVTSVTAEGAPSSATYHYTLVPPPSAKTGDTAYVRIVYSGTMGAEPGSSSWGGVFALNNALPLYAMGVGFYANYVSTTEHWMPCYDHPSDKATFHGRFVVKNNLSVASNGLLTIPPSQDSSVAIYDWNETKPCATYLLTFAVDDYRPLIIASDSIPMVVYARPGDTTISRKSFKLLPRMVELFGRKFGRYPFEKVGYVNTPTGAMEHQTMISINTILSQQGDTVYSAAAHELSHQWFGDLVTPIDYRHAWLNESFATFCESLWSEELKGFSGYLALQASDVSQYISNVSRAEGIFPIYDFPRASPSSNYPGTIYSKGAAVLGMLRYELGDSVFFGGAKDFLAQHAYGNATTEDMRTALEQKAGRSLKWFFDQWIYGKGWPQLKLQVTPTQIGGGYTRAQVTITQSQPDSFGVYTNVPVEIGFRQATGSPVYRMVKLTQKQESFAIDSLPTYTSVTVNTGPTIRSLIQVSSLSGIEFHPLHPDSNNVEFHIKPNPTKGAPTLSVEVRNVTDCPDIRYQFYNVAGRRVVEGVANTCSFVIPLDGLTSGAYIVRFRYNSTLYDLPVAVTR